MTDSAKKQQTIDCNHLTMQTNAGPDGKLYPNTINADGDVHTVDPDQDLRAGHLAVVLRPATQPSKTAAAADSATANAELQSMIAHQDVKVVTKDGTIALADQLLVDNKDGHNNLKLLGQPFAKVIDKRNTLSGPIIEMFPDTQRMEVFGAGNMVGTQQEKPGDPERPINVDWKRGMTYDGKANLIDVTGNVVAVSVDAEGATNTATGERMRMFLVDAPPTTRPSTTQATTAPTTQSTQIAAAPTTQATTQLAVATTRATTKPTTRPARGGNYTGMASTTVRSVTFDENAVVSSVTLADDGTLLRRTHLEAATVTYEMLVKRLLVPVPGRMLVEDHRPPTTKPANTVANADAQPAGSKVDGAADNNRRTTTFEWTKTFTYEEAAKQAVMTGDAQKPVIVVHRDDSPKAQIFRLTGDTVTADVEEVAITPTTKPATTNPATTQATATTKPTRTTKTEIKRITATGHLVFTGPGADIRANYMEYDPRTHWLIARGTEREPVDFDVKNRPDINLAEEVRYNLDTGDVNAVGPRIRRVR
jgi:hypothetical protein